MSHQHFTAADFERHYLRYKAEGFPRGESMEGYCFRHHVPFNLFDKWYRDTRHKIVPVTVEGAPERQEADKGESQHDTLPTPSIETGYPEPTQDAARIMIDIRTTSGLHIHQRNLSYGALLSLITKLEGIC